MIQFVFGALAGAAAAWYWRQDIEEYTRDRMPNLRAKAADRLQSIEKTAEGVIDKAKTGVVKRMRAGEERLRGEPGMGGTGTTGGASTTGGTPAAGGTSTAGPSYGERTRPQG